MNIIGIYLITCTINNKKYVGQSLDIKRRFRQHKRKQENFKFRYPTIFLPELTEDGLYDGFSVIVPDLPGCVSQGDYLLDATKMAISAIDCWLDGTDEKDYPKPSKTSEIDISEYSQEYPNLFVNIVEYDPADFKHHHSESYNEEQSAMSL